MSKKIKITKDEITSWLNSEVTEYVFFLLNSTREEINKALTSSEFIMDPESSKKLARILGQREGLDLLLQINVEDIISTLDQEVKENE